MTLYELLVAMSVSLFSLAVISLMIGFKNIDFGYNITLLDLDVCDQALFSEECFTGTELYVSGLRLLSLSLLLFTISFALQMFVLLKKWKGKEVRN